MLIEAIRMTSPRFDLEDISRGLYTTDEIKIINQLALVYSHAGEPLEAIGIFEQLRRYIHKHFCNIPLTRAHLNMIAFNYAKQLAIIGQYRKAIEIAEEGQKVCLDYGHYLSLPSLLAIQAECHHFIGSNQKSKDLYFQAYYLMKVIKHEANLEILRENAWRDLNLEFPD